MQIRSKSGLFNDVVKTRMDELEGQRTALKKALADKELAKGFKLTKDHILFFLNKLKSLNIQNLDCRKRLVDVFVNSIFVYDDHIKITFNFSGDKQTVSLRNIEDAEQGEKFVHCALSPALRNAEKPYKSRVFSVFDFLHPLQVTKKVIARTVMIKSGRFFNDLPLSLYRYYRRFFHLVCFFYIQTSFCHHGTFAAVFILLPDQSFLPSPEFLPQKHWMKIFYPPASLRFLPFLPAVFRCHQARRMLRCRTESLFFL